MLDRRDINFIVDLLDDEDMLLIQKLETQLVENKDVALEVLEERVYFAKNSKHEEHIQKAIQAVRFAFCVEKVKSSLTDKFEKEGDVFFEVQNYLYDFFLEADNDYEGESFHEMLKKEVVNKVWLFLNNEKNGLGCLAAVHLYLTATDKKKGYGEEEGDGKDNETSVVVVPNMYNSFLYHLRLTFLKTIMLANLSKSGKNIRLRGLNAKHGGIEDFFLQGVIERKTIDYLMYLILMRDILKVFKYFVDVVRLDYLDLREDEKNPLMYQGYSLMFRDEGRLLNLEKEEFMAYFWVKEKGEDEEKILYVYEDGEKKEGKIFFRVDVLEGKDLLKAYLEHMLEHVSWGYKTYCEKLLLLVKS